MKNSLLRISLLSTCFLLASCTNSTKTNSSYTSPSNSIVSNQDKKTTDNSKNPQSKDTTSTTGDEKKSIWSSSDLEAMALYLNGYNSLPFPIGLKSYVEASGTDDGKNCFVVSDSECGDLTTSYGKQLTDIGYVFDDEKSEDERSIYSYQSENSTDIIFVQLDYSSNVFEIFAWFEVGYSTYETFPYDLISSFFIISKVDESVIPSFTLASNNKYDVYSSSKDYFIIGGYYDTTITTYVTDYENKLKNIGYTANDGTAINKTSSLQVDYLDSNGYFSIQISKYNESDKGDHSIELTYSDFQEKYVDLDITKDNITFKCESVCYKDTYIQFRSNKKGAGILYNETSISSLKSIVVSEYDSNNHQFYGELSCYVSTTLIDDSNKGTSITPVYKNGVYTYSIPSNNSYFKLIDETDYASKNSSIVINYSI